MEQLTKEEVQEEEKWKAYRTYLQNRNKAENTVIAYLAAVRQYQSLYLEVTGDHLRLYKCYLIEHYKPQTVNVRVRAMNAYLEYLGMEEDKMMMVRHREQTYCDHVISQADYEYLKKCLVRDGNARYYFLVRFLAATGVRVSEVIQIRIGDVACGFRDLYSKDNQVRRIYIPRELLRDRSQGCILVSESLWGSHDCGCYSRSAAQICRFIWN